MDAFSGNFSGISIISIFHANGTIIAANINQWLKEGHVRVNLLENYPDNSLPV